ncbi:MULTISPECIES: ROK family protein [Microbacterium]|uniref:ROK family protein n=1 Tax=Microbacterium TaxID=33882 RepID=UPI001469E368|nr:MULTISPECIES: ROK family protein [Microbacterium]
MMLTERAIAPSGDSGSDRFEVALATDADAAYAPQPPGDLVLAVDLGGTKVQAALVGRRGEVLAESLRKRPTGRHRSRDALEATIVGVAEDAADCLPGGARLIGVGVSTAGPVDVERRMTSPLNLPALVDLPLGRIFAGVVDGPVHVALDGACFAVAEHWVGALRNSNNGLAVVVSTGVGGGLIVHGRCMVGRSGNAGHIGQTKIRRSRGRHSHLGTVERLASGPSTVRWAQRRGWVGSSGEELAASYAQRDTIAVAAVRRSAEAIGQAVANAATFLDLDTVVVGGGFAEVATDYVDMVREATERATVVDYSRLVTFRRATTGSLAPLIGAAASVLDADVARTAS